MSPRTLGTPDYLKLKDRILRGLNGPLKPTRSSLASKTRGILEIRRKAIREAKRKGSGI